MNMFLTILKWGWPVALLLVVAVLYFLHLRKLAKASDERTRQLKDIRARLTKNSPPLTLVDADELRTRVLDIVTEVDSDAQLALVQDCLTLLNRIDFVEP